MNPSRSSPLRRSGYSLVEALMAVTVTTIAGAALLTSVGAAVRTSTDAAHTAIARGLATPMMDEIAARRFPEATNPAPQQQTRDSFDDIDDYDGWSARPPQNRDGQTVGTETSTVSGSYISRTSSMQPGLELIGRFTRRVDVERIRPNGSSGWTVATEHTNYRRVTVRVDYTDAESNTTPLAEISRIFSYVPVTP